MQLHSYGIRGGLAARFLCLDAYMGEWVGNLWIGLGIEGMEKRMMMTREGVFPSGYLVVPQAISKIQSNPAIGKFRITKTSA